MHALCTLSPAPRPAPEVDVGSEVRHALKAFLAQPAFIHRMDVAVLTKLAGDERTPARERRRAAEALGTMYLKALELLVERGQPQAPRLPWIASGRTRGHRA